MTKAHIASQFEISLQSCDLGISDIGSAMEEHIVSFEISQSLAFLRDKHDDIPIKETQHVKEEEQRHNVDIQFSDELLLGGMVDDFG